MITLKKFILKVYLIITLLILFLSTLFLAFFNIYNLRANEEKDMKKILNIIEKSEDKENYHIDDMLKEFNISCYIILKDAYEQINDDKLKDYIKENVLNDSNIDEVFIYDDENIYYIKEYENNLAVLYKKLNINQILIRDSLICIFIIAFISAIIYLILKKYLHKKIIMPLKELSKEIPKLKDKTERIVIKDYKIEEINDICKEIKNIENDIENMGDMLNIERNKIDYILDNMTEGFVLFDENKNVFAINKIAKKILNYDHNKLGGNILYYTQNMKLLENIDKALLDGQRRIFDMKTDDNKTHSVHISKIQKGIFENGTKGIIMLIIDVTAKRESEKLKQEFFSNVSHELKTPITSIQGYAELLYNDFAKNREQEKEFLQIIQKESNNITSLLNNILTISKLENKEIEINSSDINIKTVVDEIINTTKPMCIEKNINIINKCEEIIMIGDYKKIHQLFNNLIVNAIKYNKDNGYVEINCFKDEKNINIIVKDSGIGIPLVDRNRIFERFYRVEKGRSKAMGGTGLGLSIVKHIVKYYNGKIKVKSTEGFGSEFIIKIPIINK